MDKTRFVFKFVQAARARKSKKKITSTISSVTSDTMSMDSSSTVSASTLGVIQFHSKIFFVFFNKFEFSTISIVNGISRLIGYKAGQFNRRRWHSITSIAGRLG